MLANGASNLDKDCFGFRTISYTSVKNVNKITEEKFCTIQAFKIPVYFKKFRLKD